MQSRNARQAETLDPDYHELYRAGETSCFYGICNQPGSISRRQMETSRRANVRRSSLQAIASFPQHRCLISDERSVASPPKAGIMTSIGSDQQGWAQPQRWFWEWPLSCQLL